MFTYGSSNAGRGARPVVSLPSEIQGAQVDGVWTIGATGSGTQAGVGDPAGAEYTAFHSDIVDYAKPEFKYKYSESDIDYDAKTLTVEFEIKDKYYLDGSSLLTEGTLDDKYITIAVDGDDAADSKVTKKITKVQDIKATVDGVANTKVGEKYTLVISGLEQVTIKDATGTYVEYSGPININLAAGIAADTSGNSTVAKTITVGVDEPSGEGEAEIVDVVDPVWEKTDSSIKRARDGYTGDEADTVEVILTGTDKYIDKTNSETLEKSDITIYLDGTAVSATERNNLIKSITQVEGTDEYTIQYKLVLGNFGDFSGLVEIELVDGLLIDKSGNNDNGLAKVGVGNVDWVEANDEIPTTSTLASVTNDNIGEYIDLGNDIIDGLDGTTGLTTDDWRILYVEDTDSDGTADTVYAILADYLPSAQVPASAGLDTNTTDYPYSVWSDTDRDTLLNGLLNTTAWSDFTNGIVGATATGSPTAELLMNSYNTKNGTSLVYTSYPKLSSSTEDYDLYVPHTGAYKNCYAYWLASPRAGDSGNVWAVRCNGNVNYDYFDGANSGARPVVSLPSNIQGAVVNGIWTVGASGSGTQAGVGDPAGAKFTAFQNNIVDFIKPEIKYTYSESDISHEDRTLTVDFSIEDKYFLESTLAEENIKVLIDDGTGKFVENATLSNADNITLTKVSDKKGTVNGTSQKTGENYELVISGFEAIDYSGTVQIVIDSDVAVDSSGNYTDAKTLTVGINEPSGEGEAEVVDVIDPVWKMTDYTINRKRDGAEADTVDIVFSGTDKYFKESTLTKENIKIYIFDDNDAMVQNTTITKELSNAEEVEAADGQNPGVKHTLTLGNFQDYSGYIAISIDANTLLDEYTNKNKETYIVGSASAEATDWRIFYKESTDANGDGINVFLISADYVKTEFISDEAISHRYTESQYPNIMRYGANVKNTKGDVDSETRKRYMLSRESEYYEDNDNNTWALWYTKTLLTPEFWDNFKDETYANSAVGAPTIEMWTESWNQKYPNDLLYCNNGTDYGYYIGTTTNPTGRSIILYSKDGYDDELYFPHQEYDNLDGTEYGDCWGYYLASPLSFIGDSNILTSDAELASIRYNGYIQRARATMDNNTSTGMSGIRTIVCLKSDVKAKENSSNSVWMLSETEGATLSSQISSANYGDYVDYPIILTDGIGKIQKETGILVDFIHPVWEKTDSVINRVRSGDADNSVEVTLKGTDKFLESTAITSSNVSDYVDVYVMNADGEYVKNDTITTSLLSIGEVTDGAIEAKIKLSNFGNNFQGKVAIKVLADAISDSSENKNLETELIGVGNVDWVEKAVSTTITNANIGEYIDLGNDIVDFNGTTGVTTDDWRIFYVYDSDSDGENDIIYAILSDYLPADQVPEDSGLNTDPTTYPYSVWSNTDSDTLINGLIHTETSWRGLTNGINGAEAIGSPTTDLFLKSYNANNGTSVTLVDDLKIGTKNYSLYVPRTGYSDYCYGYWFASTSAQGFMYTCECERWLRYKRKLF